VKSRSLIALAGVTLASMTLTSLAAGQGAAQRTVQIGAAVGLLASDQTAGFRSNRTPHVWFNLNSNRRVRPAGIEFSNPSHDTQYSSGLVARWNAIGATASPPLDTLVAKRDAPYWELNIDTATDAQLASLDIILISAYGNISLNTAEREKLRRFTEKGGVLWIDTTDTTVQDQLNNFSVPFSLTGTPQGTPVGFDTAQPLISFPFRVTESDLSAMQTDFTRAVRPFQLSNLGLTAYAPIFAPLETDSRRLAVVAQDNVGPYMLVSRQGDGFMVLTTRGVARSLNRIPSGAGFGNTYLDNTSASALPFSADASGDAAAKLAVNMINLVSAYPQSRGGARGAGSTSIDVGAPQLQRFVTTREALAGDSANAYRTPAVYKGIIAVANNDGTVVVYDNDPKQDLDGDGDPDDGVRDFSQGAGFDAIWTSESMPGPLGSPICYEVPGQGNPALRDQLAIVDGQGSLHIYPLFPVNANGQLDGLTAAPDAFTVAPPTGAASVDNGLTDAGPYAPVFHEGYLFMTDAQDSGLGRAGRVWVVSPITGQAVQSGPNGWSVGGASANMMTDPSGPATVGYIPVADNSGAVDKVVYVPNRPSSLGGGPNANASLSSLWFGVKGERPSNWQVSGSFLELTTRAASQGLDIYIPDQPNEDPGLGVRLTLIKPTGDPFTQAEMTSIFDGNVTQTNGIVRFTMNGAATIPANTGVRIDYTIDWGTGQPSASQQILRGNLNFPDNVNRARRLLHGIALSPEGTLHLTVSNQNPAGTGNTGGSYFAIREEGRGNFKVVNRFDLYNAHQIGLNQAAQATVNYPVTFGNSDPLTTLIPFLGGTITDQTFMSMPVIRGGVAYVTAQGNRNLFGFRVPFTFVMAFRAEPEAMVLRVGNLNSGFSILQPDLTRSTPGPTPDVYTVLQPNQYTYTAEGIDSGSIRIDNLSGTARGPITNCLSTSQPIILRQNGQADILVEPNRGSSNWNQLLWYTVFVGVENRSPVFASGDKVFIAGTSAWRNVLNGNFPPANSGQLFAMNGQISPNDTWLNPGDPNRPWFRQLWQIRGSGWANIQSNPSMLMPSTQGITSFGDYQIRLEQTILTANGAATTTANGVVGGDGGTFIWSDDGLWGFSRANFIVADSSRVTRVDSVGSPIWTLTSTYRTGIEGDPGSAGNIRPLVNVARAYPLDNRQLLLVDSGANRIIRTDSTGRELRSLQGFVVDNNFSPPGFQPNASRTLSGPRDAKMWTRVVTAANNPLSTPQPTEFWVHYLIADTGNRRLIEVVDRYQYDAVDRRVGNPIRLGVLTWHSPADVSGGKFAYSALDRVFVDDPISPRWVYAAAIGNANPTRVDLGLDAVTPTAPRSSNDGNGGLVIFDGTGSIVVNQVNLPAIGANVYHDEATNTWTSPAENARVKLLGGLNSISMRNLSGGAVAIMITDNDGAYEVAGQLNSSAVFDVQWMINRQTYRSIRRDGADNILFTDNPNDFRPTYAKRLESGDVLITNGYTGFYRRALATDPRVTFTGEVILLEGGFDGGGTAELGFNFNKRNFGFRSISIRALLNNKPGANLDTRGIVAPVFADKQ
jgi:hypothetical protein